MILGLGIDLVDIRRIEKLMQTHNARFLEKTFTKNEIEGAQKYTSLILKASYFAKRFAAKEAFAKAVGTGLSEEVTFLSIEISNLSSGKPYITLLNPTKDKLDKTYPNTKIKIDLSLSDEYPMAQACVIISTND